MHWKAMSPPIRPTSGLLCSFRLVLRLSRARCLPHSSTALGALRLSALWPTAIQIMDKPSWCVAPLGDPVPPRRGKAWPTALVRRARPHGAGRCGPPSQITLWTVGAGGRGEEGNEGGATLGGSGCPVRHRYSERTVAMKVTSSTQHPSSTSMSSRLLGVGVALSPVKDAAVAADGCC